MLSNYVTRYLLKKGGINTKFISRAKTIANNMNNRAFLGWVHELEMLFFFQRFVGAGAAGSCFTLPIEPLGNSNQQKQTITIQLSEQEEFEHISELQVSSQSQKVLILPNRFNQACFDGGIVMFDSKEQVLITLQATVAKTHDFKAKSVRELVDQLVLNSPRKRTHPKVSVWHIFVLESEEQFNKFGFKDDSGARGKNWSKTVFWKALLKQKEEQVDSKKHKKTMKQASSKKYKQADEQASSKKHKSS
jgi:hypothetical protein